jgi:hypothetical protein
MDSDSPGHAEVLAIVNRSFAEDDTTWWMHWAPQAYMINSDPARTVLVCYSSDALTSELTNKSGCDFEGLVAKGHTATGQDLSSKSTSSRAGGAELEEQQRAFLKGIYAPDFALWEAHCATRAAAAHGEEQEGLMDDLAPVSEVDVSNHPIKYVRVPHGAGNSF